MATTAPAIRDAMIALLEAATPTVHTGQPFRAYREHEDFREWAGKNPDACLRRFSIRYLGSMAPAAVSNILEEERSDTFEVVIAYPASSRHGGRRMTGLDDIIYGDQKKAHATIGPPGYQSLTATACVLHQDDWEREDADAVLFAVVRYDVHWYEATGALPSNVNVTGLYGALPEGTILTLAGDGEDALRALVVENGLFKLTYEEQDGQEPASLQVYLKIDGAWTRICSTVYGDWSFFVAPIEVAYDEIEIIEASGDAVEVAFRLLVHELDVPYLSSFGVTSRDEDGGANYHSNATVKAITELRVTKLIRMERGKAGYFHAWHSEPRCAPSLKNLLDGPGSVENNESDFGEREFGPGYGSSVAFSSNEEAGVARFPAWGDRAIWDTAATEIGQAIPNHTFWFGIDDANYGVMAHASYAQTQNNAAGFPRQQLTGPWWFADIPSTAVVTGICRYNVQQMPLESGVWQFGSALGQSTNHFCHSWPDDDGRMLKFQVFYGAFAYDADTSSDYANEPKQVLRDECARLAAALEWPS
jgi:hypothetical protein